MWDQLCPWWYRHDVLLGKSRTAMMSVMVVTKISVTSHCTITVFKKYLWIEIQVCTNYFFLKFASYNMSLYDLQNKVTEYVSWKRELVHHPNTGNVPLFQCSHLVMRARHGKIAVFLTSVRCQGEH